ncbi:elongin-A [Coccidioides immitis RS]|uniref:Elongin-A n=1 Tax=Coccidioides immitis (strain RS) TaxID=246410 RepID=J3KHZ4_COCIM|nr:elongin-A [Coccidioides immitis RS]EAS35532.3 elongin-A [Coccidioides immitis RS]
MVVPSLLHMARRACVKQAKAIDDVGDAPYGLVRPILLKVENPRQLHALETNSPQLKEYTGEIWIEFIKRDIPFWRDVKLPENPESWFNFYRSLRQQALRELELQAERIKQAMNGLRSEKAKHSPKVVNARKLGLPQEKPTSLQKYANYDRQMGGLQPVFVRARTQNDKGLTPYSQTSRWTFEKPKLPTTTKPKKSTLPVAKRNKRLCIPTHQLNKRASAIKKAPISFVEDYKYEQRLAQRNTDRKVPAARASPPKRIKESSTSSQRPASSLTRPNSSGLGRPQTITAKPPGLPLTEPKLTLSGVPQPRPATAKPPRLETPKQNASSSTATPQPDAKPLTPPKAVGPPRRRPPPNPLLIPKRRAGPLPAQMLTGPARQSASSKRLLDSGLAGSDAVPERSRVKKQRIS